MARRSSSTWVILAILGTAFIALGANASCMDADCTPRAVGEGMMVITSMPSEGKPLTGTPKPACDNPVNCLVDPCISATCPTGSQCVSNYCGGCNFECMHNDDRVYKGGKGHAEPAEGKPLAGTPKPACDNPVKCLVDPCSTARCMEGTKCVSDYCGGCNAQCIPDDGRVYKGGAASGAVDTDVKVILRNNKPTADTTCKDGSKPVQCFADPCTVSNKCPAGTTCRADYCSGCNTRCFNKAGVEVKARVEAVAKPIMKPVAAKACNLACIKDSMCVVLGSKPRCVPKAQMGATLSAAFAAGFKAGKAQCA